MNEQQSPAPQAEPVNPAPFEGVPTPPAPVTESVTVTAAQPEPIPAQPGSPAPVATEPDYRALYESLRRENEILRQNAEASQRAPVQGVSGGGAVAAPVDDFIRGFDSDTWE